MTIFCYNIYKCIWIQILIDILYVDINNKMEEIEENIGGRGISRARGINV